MRNYNNPIANNLFLEINGGTIKQFIEDIFKINVYPSTSSKVESNASSQIVLPKKLKDNKILVTLHYNFKIRKREDRIIIKIEVTPTINYYYNLFFLEKISEKMVSNIKRDTATVNNVLTINFYTKQNNAFDFATILREQAKLIEALKEKFARMIEDNTEYLFAILQQTKETQFQKEVFNQLKSDYLDLELRFKQQPEKTNYIKTDLSKLCFISFLKLQEELTKLIKIIDDDDISAHLIEKLDKMKEIKDFEELKETVQE